MLYGGHNGGLELRKRASGAMALHGRFPYNKRAVLSDGGRTGRPKKEVIASRAFAYRVNDPKADIHFLVGHSYDRPLASRKAGTLVLSDSDDALTFDATITEDMLETSYVQDFLRAFFAGLMLGLSPGFRIPPKRAVENAESVENEGHDPANGAHNAIIRTVQHALLYELSAVTVPAYDEAQIESRSWTTAMPDVPAKRWRAAAWR